ncbi:MAG: AAA domain-containing protein [Candidatus Wallbacteria bacterium]
MFDKIKKLIINDELDEIKKDIEKLEIINEKHPFLSTDGKNDTLYDYAEKYNKYEIMQYFSNKVSALLINSLNNIKKQHHINFILKFKPDLKILEQISYSSKITEEFKNKIDIILKCEKTIKLVENQKFELALETFKDIKVKYKSYDEKTIFQVVDKTDRIEIKKEIVKKLFEEIRSELDNNQSNDTLTGQLNELSKNINSENIHFIFELVQNAEDNYYDPNLSEKTLIFILNNDIPLEFSDEHKINNYLLIQNNELGFNDLNIISICDATKSTKKKKKGYIGEKGIGFKSVFKVTKRPYIFSNGFNFYLTSEGADPIKYIYPHDEDFFVEGNLPGIIKKEFTNILLPLEDLNIYKEIKKQLESHISFETLLFLKKLNKIEIRIGEKKEVIQKIENKDSIIIELKKETYEKESLKEKKCDKYFIYYKEINTQGIKDDLRPNISTSEITLSFPINSNNSYGKIYAYLPTNINSGLPFLINADFILTSNRESIKDKSEWNNKLIEMVPDIFIEFFKITIQKKYISVNDKYSLYKFIPKFYNNLLEENLFERAKKEIINKLKSEKIILGIDNNLYLPKNVIAIPEKELNILFDDFNNLNYENIPSFLKKEENILINMEIWKNFSNYETFYETIKVLELKEFEFANFVECLLDDQWINIKWNKKNTEEIPIKLYNYISDKLLNNNDLNIKKDLLSAKIFFSVNNKLLALSETLMVNDEWRRILTKDAYYKDEILNSIIINEQIYIHYRKLLELIKEFKHSEFKDIIKKIDKDWLKNNLIKSLEEKSDWFKNFYTLIVNSYNLINDPKEKEDFNSQKIFLGKDKKLYSINDQGELNLRLIDNKNKNILYKLYRNNLKELEQKLKTLNIVEINSELVEILEKNNCENCINVLSEENFISCLDRLNNYNTLLDINEKEEESFKFLEELYDIILGLNDNNIKEKIKNIKLFPALHYKNIDNDKNTIFLHKINEITFLEEQEKIFIDKKIFPEEFDKKIFPEEFDKKGNQNYSLRIKKYFPNEFQIISFEEIIEYISDFKWVNKYLEDDKNKKIKKIYNCLFSKIKEEEKLIQQIRKIKFILNHNGELISADDSIIIYNGDSKFFESYHNYVEDYKKLEKIYIEEDIEVILKKIFGNFLKEYDSKIMINGIIDNLKFTNYNLLNEIKKNSKFFYNYIFNFLKDDKNKDYIEKFKEIKMFLGEDNKFYNSENILIDDNIESKIFENLKYNENSEKVIINKELKYFLNEDIIEKLGFKKLDESDIIKILKNSSIKNTLDYEWYVKLYDFFRKNSVDNSDLKTIKFILTKDEKLCSASDNNIKLFIPTHNSEKTSYCFDSSAISTIEFINENVSNKLNEEIKTWLRDNLDINEFNHLNYIRDIVFGYINKINCIDKTKYDIKLLIKITYYLAENLDVWKQDSDLIDNMFLLTTLGIKKIHEIKNKTIVFPENFDDEYGWQLVYPQLKELKEYIILSDDYLNSFNNREKNKLKQLFEKLKVTNYPLPPSADNKEIINFQQNIVQTLNYSAPNWLKQLDDSSKTEIEKYKKNIDALLNYCFNFEYDIFYGEVNNEKYKKDYRNHSDLYKVLCSKKIFKDDKNQYCYCYELFGEKFKEDLNDVNFINHEMYEKYKNKEKFKELFVIENNIEGYIKYLKNFSELNAKPQKEKIEKIYGILGQKKDNNILNDEKNKFKIIFFESKNTDGTFWFEWYNYNDKNIVWDDYNISKLVTGVIPVKSCFPNLRTFFVEKLKIKKEPEFDKIIEFYKIIENDDSNEKIKKEDIKSFIKNFYLKYVLNVTKEKRKIYLEKFNVEERKIYNDNEFFSKNNEIVYFKSIELKKIFKNLKSIWLPSDLVAKYKEKKIYEASREIVDFYKINSIDISDCKITQINELNSATKNNKCIVNKYFKELLFYYYYNDLYEFEINKNNIIFERIKKIFFVEEYICKQKIEKNYKLNVKNKIYNETVKEDSYLEVNGETLRLYYYSGSSERKIYNSLASVISRYLLEESQKAIEDIISTLLSIDDEESKISEISSREWELKHDSLIELKKLLPELKYDDSDEDNYESNNELPLQQPAKSPSSHPLSLTQPESGASINNSKEQTFLGIHQGKSEKDGNEKNNITQSPKGNDGISENTDNEKDKNPDLDDFDNQKDQNKENSSGADKQNKETIDNVNLENQNANSDNSNKDKTSILSNNKNDAENNCKDDNEKNNITQSPKGNDGISKNTDSEKDKNPDLDDFDNPKDQNKENSSEADKQNKETHKNNWNLGNENDKDYEDNEDTQADALGDNKEKDHKNNSNKSDQQNNEKRKNNSNSGSEPNKDDRKYNSDDEFDDFYEDDDLDEDDDKQINSNKKDFNPKQQRIPKKKDGFNSDPKEGDPDKIRKFNKRNLDNIIKKSNRQKKILDKITELEKEVNNAEEYSKKWFEVMFEIEYYCQLLKHGSKNEYYSVNFNSVKLVNEKFLILESSDNYYNVDHIDENMILRINNYEVAVDTFSYDEKSLKVKLINGYKLPFEHDNLSAELTVSNSKFVIEILKNKFYDYLNKIVDKKLIEVVKNNSTFIFGPPGTGKTTNLAREIIEIIKKNEQTGKKILVLTPTNKAADVLTLRILKEIKAKDSSLNNSKWLKRYGYSFADEITNSNDIYVKRNENITLDSENLVIVTTIARYPYDSFKLNGQIFHFVDYEKWDYILFDEASMIFLPSILLPYMANINNKNLKYIVAGDPFQIPPIVEYEGWLNKNIYKMINLDKFEGNDNSNVKYLKTHYRSIEPIMNLINKLNYNNNLIMADKDKKSDYQLTIGSSKEVLKPISTIKYTCTNDIEIFNVAALNYSSYHIYSALLAVEMIQKLIVKFNHNSNREQISVGIITPYGAQRDIIKKLLGVIKIPKNIIVSCSTAHGFQGDECDVIIAAFNIPKFNSDLAHINNNNIINVAISRAKYNLIMLMPDQIYSNYKVLDKISNIVEKNNEFEFKNYTHEEIEKMMFGSDSNLKNMTYIASHQKVNVYSESKIAHKYEIRKGDNDTIDIFVTNVVDALNSSLPTLSKDCSNDKQSNIKLIEQLYAKLPKEISDYIDAKYHRAINELCLRYNKIPEMSYELTEINKTKPLAHAYVAFIDEKTAVLLETQLEDEKKFKEYNWRVIKLDFDGKIIE